MRAPKPLRRLIWTSRRLKNNFPASERMRNESEPHWQPLVLDPVFRIFNETSNSSRQKNKLYKRILAVSKTTGKFQSRRKSAANSSRSGSNGNGTAPRAAASAVISGVNAPRCSLRIRVHKSYG